MGLFNDIKTISINHSINEVRELDDIEKDEFERACNRVRNFFKSIVNKIKKVFNSIVSFFRTNADSIFLSMVVTLENADQLQHGSIEKVKNYIKIKNRTKSKRIRKKQYKKIGIATSKFV